MLKVLLLIVSISSFHCIEESSNLSSVIVEVEAPTSPPSPIVEVPAPTNLEIIERVKEITLKFSEALENSTTTSAKPPVTSRRSSSRIKLEQKYHNYEELTTFLKDVSGIYPRITHLYSIGKSIEGRDLWVLAIGANPKNHMLGRPEVKLIGNILGNEPLTREILLRFIVFLVTNYQSNSGIKSLLNKMRLHVMPSMNPDGAEKFHMSNSTMCRGPTDGRKNAADVDLNRSFPSPFRRIPQTGPAPERDAVQEWMKRIPFLMSLSFRSGAVVVTFPYDSAPLEERKRSAISASGSIESLTPDDDVFRYLANTYSSSHDSMFLGRPCNIDGRNTDRSFDKGIINGAAWQILDGGMQDYNYAQHGTLEITAYISCCKYRDPRDIDRVWLDNRNALQLILAEANRGVRGYVTTEDGTPIANASMFIIDREKAIFKSTEEGEFWRILLPGYYTLEIKAEGFEVGVVPFIVDEESPKILNITLSPLVVSTQSFESTTSGDGEVGNITENDSGAFSGDGSTMSVDPLTTRLIPRENILLVYKTKEKPSKNSAMGKNLVGAISIMIICVIQTIVSFEIS